jgi:outer membrane protein assembly factor BamD
MRRFVLPVVLALAVIGLAGCHKKKVTNPLADVGSKQPDKVLFDRAMDLMKKNRWDQARLVLQTLINTYPDSEYIARAKLAVGDSWYAEGSTTALAQAENEYRDFETFFPNMVEASEAQMKIANIHYKQMEKADRDYTHAKRAEEEYRTMLTQYPDSPLVPEAKARLREVQEVLAEREFLIGRFYFLRESYMAAQARLQTMVDTYPLFSGADEALYMLGQIGERQADAVRASKLAETQKGELIRMWTNKAAASYSKIITRYPVTDRVPDAKARLEALKRPVPTPTPEAIAQNKAEQESRETLSHVQEFKLLLHRRPDTAQTAKTGEPTLVDPPQTSAPILVRSNEADVIAAVSNKPLPSETKAAEAPKSTKAGSDQAAPVPEAPKGIGELQTLPNADTGGTNRVEAQPGKGGTPGANQPPPSNEPPPSTSVPPSPPPPQVNEAAGNQQSADAVKTADKQDDKQSSSSAKKKKKGLKKIVPF